MPTEYDSPVTIAASRGCSAPAPSVALATLGLTIARQGAAYATVECRSMVAGAAALGVYSAIVCVLLAAAAREHGFYARVVRGLLRIVVPVPPLKR
jgi:hypothetical protein